MSELHNILAERSIVAAILRDPPRYWQAAKIVRPEMFRFPDLRLVFVHCGGQVESSGAISTGSVIEAVRGMQGDLSTAWVMDLFDEVVSAVNLPADCEVVRGLWMAREAVSVCEAAQAGLEEDPKECVVRILEAAGRLSGLTRATVLTESSDLEFADEVLELSKPSGAPIRLPIGCGHLVARRGELTVVAGKPSFGKSTLGLALADWFAANIGRTRFHSMEMKRRQVARRLMCRDLGVSSGSLWGDRISQLFPEWRQMRQNIALTVDDKASIPIEELSAACREQHIRQPLSAIFVDYLQLTTVAKARKNGSIADETATKSHALKQLAMDLDVPVIALAQFNRDGKKKDRPTIYDLEGGGAIENDADQIWVMHDHGLTPSMDGTERRDIVLSVDKHREGWKGDVWINMDFGTYSVRDSEFQPGGDR